MFEWSRFAEQLTAYGRGIFPEPHESRSGDRAGDKAQRLPERHKMMQAWADYLDSLREGANVVPIRRAS
jgi:hypothetical protein